MAVGLNESAKGTPKDKNGNVSGVYPWGTNWPPSSGAGNYFDSTAKASFPNWTVIDGYTDGYATTSPVGSFNPNQNGLYDMGGNVEQWCEDKYSRFSGTRVFRGASWLDRDPWSLLSSARDDEAPETRLLYLGFRVVLVAGTFR